MRMKRLQIQRSRCAEAKYTSRAKTPKGDTAEPNRKEQRQTQRNAKGENAAEGERRQARKKKTLDAQGKTHTRGEGGGDGEKSHKLWPKKANRAKNDEEQHDGKSSEPRGGVRKGTWKTKHKLGQRGSKASRVTNSREIHWETAKDRIDGERSHIA